MKIATIVSLTIATAGLLALASPVQAQRHGGNGGGGRSMNHGGGPSVNHGGGPSGMNHGGGPGFNHGGNGNNGNFHGGNHNFHGGRCYGGNRVNFFFGGFGYPYYGYGYGYGYPYGYGYGYPYSYGYGYPYGYGYATGGYSYDPQGIYNGRVVRGREGRHGNVRDGKDRSSLEAQVQEQLAQSGYYRGNIDGVVGEGTRRAIRSYERANGLRVDGRIDNELLSTMGLG